MLSNVSFGYTLKEPDPSEGSTGRAKEVKMRKPLDAMYGIGELALIAGLVPGALFVHNNALYRLLNDGDFRQLDAELTKLEP